MGVFEGSNAATGIVLCNGQLLWQPNYLVVDHQSFCNSLDEPHAMSEVRATVPAHNLVTNVGESWQATLKTLGPRGAPEQPDPSRHMDALSPTDIILRKSVVLLSI